MANPEPLGNRAKAGRLLAGALIAGGLLLLGGALLADDDPVPAAGADGQVVPTTVEATDAPDDTDPSADASEANPTEPPQDGSGTPAAGAASSEEWPDFPWLSLGRDFEPVAAAAKVVVGGLAVYFDLDRTLGECFIIPTSDDGSVVFNGTFQLAEEKTSWWYMSIADNANGAIIGGLAGGPNGEPEWDFGGDGAMQFEATVPTSGPGWMEVIGVWKGTATSNDDNSEQRNAQVAVGCVYEFRDLPGILDNLEWEERDINFERILNAYLDLPLE